MWSTSLVLSNTIDIGLLVKSVEGVEVSLELEEEGEKTRHGWLGWATDLTDSNGEIVRGYLVCKPRDLDTFTPVVSSQ